MGSQQLKLVVQVSVKVFLVFFTHLFGYDDASQLYCQMSHVCKSKSRV